MAFKLTVLGIFIIFGGAVTLGLGWMVHREDLVKKSWKQTRGHILNCAVVRTSLARLRMPSRSMSPQPKPSYKEVPVWTIDVEYQYEVEGQKLTGSKATSSLLVEEIRSPDSKPSEGLVTVTGKVAAGSTVPVYYNPSDPEDSYLVYIQNPRKARLFTVGVVCAALGGIVVLGGRLLA